MRRSVRIPAGNGSTGLRDALFGTHDVDNTLSASISVEESDIVIRAILT